MKELVEKKKGGVRKNCSRGYNCGGSCISRRRACISELTEKETAIARMLIKSGKLIKSVGDVKSRAASGRGAR